MNETDYNFKGRVMVQNNHSLPMQKFLKIRRSNKNKRVSFEEKLKKLYNQPERDWIDYKSSDKVEQTCEVVIDHFQILGVTYENLFERTRRAEVVMARFIIMHFNKDLGCFKLGKKFNLNHATVINGFKKIDRFMSYDKQFVNFIEELEDRI